MSGRRLKAEIMKFIGDRGEFDLHLCGLTNIYTGYCTTPEEYDIQRYEGGHTLFGPHTLDIYIDQFKKLLSAMVFENTILSSGPSPADERWKQISLQPKVIYDTHGLAPGFGHVSKQPQASYALGETVTCTFVTGNPRNNWMHDSSYFFVEIKNGDDWKPVANDANWETKFIWTRDSTLLGTSSIEFFWEIPKTATPGDYRVTHQGHYKSLVDGVKPYEGKTQVFTIA